MDLKIFKKILLNKIWEKIFQNFFAVLELKVYLYCNLKVTWKPIFVGVVK